MTDEITQQPQQNQPKKDAKKATSNGSAQQGNNRGPRRNPSVSKPSSGSGPPPQGTPRPSSGAGGKKPSNSAAPESGSDTGKKGSEGKRNDSRGRGSGSARPAHRKGPSSVSQGNRQGGNNGKEQSAGKQSTPPAPIPGADASDALSSLQRVIADLKTTSPPNQTFPLSGGTMTSSSSMPLPQTTTSTLPANAPIFTPGASGFPPPNANEPPPRHRKAASLGTSALSGNFNNFSPHLVPMMEDIEEGYGNGNGSYEEGEIHENLYSTQGHHPRSQSQNFTAPRFAALAAQQEQSDIVGPSGRPQLAPGFMFGARRRPSTNSAMGPPISEEDIGFQFPQQQTLPGYAEQEPAHRRSESTGEIRGIMAEQV